LPSARCGAGRSLWLVVPLDVAEFTRWRAAAGRALDAAAAAAAGGFFEWSCFLAEQGAQLAVKGLLHGVGAGGWGHDVAALVASVPDALGGELWPDTAGQPAERLARFYLATRYPDAVPGGVPGDRFTDADAASACSDARWLIAAADAAWEALQAEAHAGEGS
jgi:HEPN domain-containing protein